MGTDREPSIKVLVQKDVVLPNPEWWEELLVLPNLYYLETLVL